MHLFLKAMSSLINFLRQVGHLPLQEEMERVSQQFQCVSQTQPDGVLSLFHQICLLDVSEDMYHLLIKVGLETHPMSGGGMFIQHLTNHKRNARIQHARQELIFMDIQTT